MPYQTKQSKSVSQCLNCGLTFSRLIQHLSSNSICNQFYTERRSGGTSNVIRTRSQLRQTINSNGVTSLLTENNTNIRRSSRLSQLETIPEVTTANVTNNLTTSNTTNFKNSGISRNDHILEINNYPNESNSSMSSSCMDNFNDQSDNTFDIDNSTIDVDRDSANSDTIDNHIDPFNFIYLSDVLKKKKNYCF